MSYRQSVDLNVDFCAGIRFNDEQAKQAHENTCVDARTRQTVRFAVAPRRKLHTPRGTLTPGAEVLESDFEGKYLATRDGNGNEVRHPVPAWRALRDAVQEGCVLEAHHVAV